VVHVSALALLDADVDALGADDVLAVTLTEAAAGAGAGASAR